MNKFFFLWRQQNFLIRRLSTIRNVRFFTIKLIHANRVILKTVMTGKNNSSLEKDVTIIIKADIVEVLKLTFESKIFF